MLALARGCDDPASDESSDAGVAVRSRHSMSPTRLDGESVVIATLQRLRMGGDEEESTPYSYS
jgi:hypothetical protein